MLLGCCDEVFLLWSIYKNGRGKKWEYENTVAACYKKSCLKGFFAHTFYIDIIIKNKYNRNATSWDYSLKTQPTQLNTLYDGYNSGRIISNRHLFLFHQG